MMSELSEVAAIPELIGRAHELHQFERSIRDLSNGRGQCVLIAGEAGIGKTYLAETVAERARQLGVVTSWGRCWESGGAPAFWPWRQLLRDCLQRPELSALAEHLGPARSLLATEAPWMSVHRRDAEHARFALFEGVISFLNAASRLHPLLLLVDDIHAADIDTLWLTCFVAQSLRDLPILLVATSREGATAADAQERLADLRRDGTLLALNGLSEAEVGAVLQRALVDRENNGSAPLIQPELIHELWQVTQGNPLFVREIARALFADRRRLTDKLQELSAAQLPQQIADAIYRRMRPLRAETRAVLRVASVMGREFDTRMLRAFPEPEWADEALPRLIDEAVAAGIVKGNADNPFRFTFSHALVRDRIYSDIEPSRRAAMHAAMGSAIELVCGKDDPDHAAELAHHFSHGAAWGEADRALRYTLTAAQRASALCAYDEAARLWEGALLLVPLGSQGEAEKNRQRCEVLLGLGEALNDKGERTRAREIFGRAAQAARDLSSAELLAKAALGYGGGWLGASEVTRPESAPGAVLDEALAAMLREALAAGDEVPPALRARLSARLAVETYFVATADEREEMSREALEPARALADPLTLASVLYDSTVAIWGPHNARERLDRCRELARLGQHVKHVGLELAGRGLCLVTTLNLGDVDAWRAEQSTFRTRTEENPLPVLLWHLKLYNTMSALLAADLDRVETLAMDAFETGQRTQRPAIICYNMQIMALRREQGRLAELSGIIGLFKAVAEQYPTLPHVSAAVAYLYHELGQMDEAREAFERAAGDGFSRLREDLTWLTAMIELAEVCVGLQDRDRAQQLYDRLLPYASYNSMAAFAAVCGGSVARSLGGLAAVLELWNDSERHFQVAIERNAAFDARLWLAHTQLDYARMIFRKREAGVATARDVGRARQLHADATAMAEALNLSLLQQRCAALAPMAGVDTGNGKTVTAEISSGADGHAYSFQRRGDYWIVTYEGTSFHLKHTAGAGFIAHMLRRPGHEIHALELLGFEAANGGGRELSAAELRTQGLRSTTLRDSASLALVDARAKAEYKARLDELSSELEEAQAERNPVRAEAIQEEIDSLVTELSRAAGLGGRARRTGTTAERARVNVTRAIGIAMKRIRAHHPELADHLARTLRTGTFCAYAPDPRLPIEWST